jgi:Tol biopolymer transport system component
MTARNDFNGVISDWLDEQAGRGAPDYLDEILARTTRTRQRPAWSSLERWLPVQTTLRFAPAPRLAWLLVLIALIAALGIAVLAVGSRSTQLPAPFGLARNGAILFGGTDHDIHTLDPMTGATTALIAGSASDARPWLSPDGTRFIFLRDTAVTDPKIGGLEPMIMVAKLDGSDVRPVTGALAGLLDAKWSSDGSKVVVSSEVDSKPALQLFTVDGSAAPLVIDTAGMTPEYVAFRQGDREITFRATRADGTGGLYSVGADGHGLRTIRLVGQGDYASLSPDGSKIAYQVWDGTAGIIHVVDVVTGQDSIPAFDSGGATGLIDDAPMWSPDAGRILFVRYHGSTTYHLAVAPVTGGHAVEIGPAMPSNTGRTDAQFSPDGTKVIARYHADGSTWILDPTGATAGSKLPSTIADPATWQRLAP